MDIPTAFAVDDATAAGLLGELETGHLVTMTDDGLATTFLPLVHVPGPGTLGSLRGHIARQAQSRPAAWGTFTQPRPRSSCSALPSAGSARSDLA